MSKNVKLMLDGETKTYTGVSTVQIPTTNGGTAEFKDVDEIVTPSGDKNINANGTYDVSAFARAVVNIPTEGDSPVLQTKSVTITENGTTQILPDDGNDGMTAVNVTVNVPVTGEGMTVKTGHLVLDADAEYIKITGLGFTPKAFAVSPTNVIQNSTCGGIFANGSGNIWRTATNGTAVNSIAHDPKFNEFNVLPDDTIGGLSETFKGSIKILETGFIVCAYADNFLFRAGAEFDWWAMG
jgi:hypothetical protein